MNDDNNNNNIIIIIIIIIIRIIIKSQKLWDSCDKVTLTPMRSYMGSWKRSEMDRVIDPGGRRKISAGRTGASV